MTEIAVRGHRERVLEKFPLAMATDGVSEGDKEDRCHVVYIINGINGKTLGLGPNDEAAWEGAYYNCCIDN